MGALEAVQAGNGFGRGAKSSRRFRTIVHAVFVHVSGATTKALCEGGTHGLFEPFDVTALEPGQGDHLLELFSIAIDPSEHRQSLLFRAMTHIEHGAAQYGDPQDLLGALRWREGRG